MNIMNFFANSALGLGTKDDKTDTQVESQAKSLSEAAPKQFPKLQNIIRSLVAEMKSKLKELNNDLMTKTVEFNLMAIFERFIKQIKEDKTATPNFDELTAEDLVAKVVDLLAKKIHESIAPLGKFDHNRSREFTDRFMKVLFPEGQASLIIPSAKAGLFAKNHSYDAISDFIDDTLKTIFVQKDKLQNDYGKYQEIVSERADGGSSSN